MRFGETYQHNGNSNYLIIKGKEEHYGSFADKIIQENEIAGLLPCQYRIINGETFFYYKINSLQSLSKVFEKRKVTYNELTVILNEMKKCWKETESFLLEQKKLVLLPEYVFADFNLKKLFFCYYPDYDESLSYEPLASFFVECVDYKDSRAVELAYGFHGQICKENVYFPEIVAELLCEKEIREESPVCEMPPEPAVKVEEKEKSLQVENVKHFFEKPAYIGLIVLLAEAVLFFGLRIAALYQGILVVFITILIFLYKVWSDKKKSEPEDTFEIELAGEEPEEAFREVCTAPVEETVFLCREKNVELHRLVYQGRDKVEDFELNVFPFVLGKAERGIDGTIAAPQVSRIHCQINYVNQEYSLQDLNSTNGTYLNGILLAPRQEISIQPGDQIRLANQPFLFQ